MHTVLILNPVARKSLLAETQEEPQSIEEEICTALRIYNIAPEVWYTTLEDLGVRLARKAADEHVDLVIAAGGDDFEASLFPAGEELKKTGLLSTVQGVIMWLVSLLTFKPTRHPVISL